LTGDTPFLTELQLAVMRVLWDRDRATAAEITEALKPARGLAQNTIATILSRLEKRGVVGHDASGRQFLYFAKLSEPAATESMVAELTDRLFDGDVTALVSHLITAKDFSRGDLARVKALIDQHEVKREKTR
jgi:predicted transcriptional regulator